MDTAFAPFTEYVQYLAEGKFDAFLDSHCRRDKVCLPEFEMSTDPNLLLHGLGKFVDMKKIKKLFVDDTVYIIFNP